MDSDGQNIPPRRLNLADGLIVIVGLAISLERLSSTGWLSRMPETLRMTGKVISELAGWSAWSVLIGYTRRDAMITLAMLLIDEMLIQPVCAVAIGLMVAQPLLRLRSPRPPGQHLVRQSGFVASIVAMGSVVLLFASVGDNWYTQAVLSSTLVRGVGVALFWIVIGIPPWRTEASAIDRLGRAVGWCLIVAIAAGAVLDQL